MDVFECGSMHFELSIRDAEHGIEIDISLGIGVSHAAEISAKRQVAPTAGLYVLSGGGQDVHA
jgi:hypothetical protein